MYVLLPDTMREPLPFLKGVSYVSLLDKLPIPPVMCLSFLLPSLVFISKTDEILPPYLAGILPLYNSASFVMSELKTEKKPNKCEAL